jgi:hypothetical protein
MDDVLERLKSQLELQEWPDVYFFKFIVPNAPEKIAQVSALFHDEAEITMHQSKTGKYISFSVKEMMLDVDSILDKYREAAKIEGIIAL